MMSRRIRQSFRIIVLLLLVTCSYVTYSTLASTPQQFLPEEKALTTKLLNAELLADKRDIVASLHALFLFYLKHDLLTQAEFYAKLALDKLENTQNMPQMYVDMVKAYSTTLLYAGKFNEAQRQLSMAMKHLDQINDEAQSNLYFNKAFLYAMVGDRELAFHFYTIAYEKTKHERSGLNLLDRCEYNKDSPPVESAKIILQLAKLWIANRSRLQYAIKVQKCAVSVLANSEDYYKIVSQSELALSFLISGNNLEAEDIAKRLLDNPDIRLPQKIDMLMLLIDVDIKKSTPTTLGKVSDALRNKSKPLPKPLQNSERAILDRIETLSRYFTLTGGFYNVDFSILDKVSFPLKLLNTYELLLRLHIKTGRLEKPVALLNSVKHLNDKYQRSVANPAAWAQSRSSLMDTYWTMYSQEMNESLPHRQNEYKKQLVSFVANDYEHSYSNALNLKNMPTAKVKDKEHIEALNNSYKALISMQKQFSTERSLTDKQERSLAIQRDKFSTLLNRDNEEKLISLHRQFDLSERVIPQNTIIYRYIVTTQHAFLITLSPQSIQVFTLPSPETIKNAVTAYNENILNSRHHGTQLLSIMEKIFPTTVLHDRISRIVIIPDGELNHLPFASLKIVKHSNKNTYLISDYSLLYSFTLNDYFANRRKEPTDTSLQEESVIHSRLAVSSDVANTADTAYDVSVLANPEFSSGTNELRLLRDSKREVEAIQHAFAFSSISIATRHNANKSFLLAKKTRQSKVLHLATHGYVNPSNPELVGLALAPTGNEESFGFLSLSELSQYPIKSELVVIAGCETSNGKNYRGAGLKSMLRGFVLQGAASVVGTLWPVQDRATSVFISEFYAQLVLAKGNTANALKNTQSIFAKSGRYRHPKYWAGFVLFVKNHNSQSLSILADDYTAASTHKL